MNRKHTVHVFRDLPDLIYKMLSGVTVLQRRIDEEIATMKAWVLPVEIAHHLLILAVKRAVVPASQLPRVLQHWERPKYEEFLPRTAWSLFNAVTEVTKSRSPRAEMDAGLRLSEIFRDVVPVQIGE